MKYFTLLLFSVLSTLSVGQNKSVDLPDLDVKEVKLTPPEKVTLTPPDTSVKLIVQSPPTFPGGPAALKQFIADKVKAINPKLSGTLLVRVVVEIDGTLSYPTITKNIPNCQQCDQEGINIIKSMPKWTAAELDGKQVRCYYNVPIKFAP